MAQQHSNKKVGEAPEELSIGQVVYILSTKGQAILPAVIIEQSIIRTIENSSISWKLAIGKANDPARPQKIVDSRKINGEIYASLDEIKDVLNSRLSAFIQKLVSTAQQREENWYGRKPVNPASADATTKKDPQAEENTRHQQQIDPETILEEMGSAHGAELVGILNKENLKDRLKHMVSLPEEEIEEDSLNADDFEDSVSQNQSTNIENNGTVKTVVGPDGAAYRVNFEK